LDGGGYQNQIENWKEKNNNKIKCNVIIFNLQNNPRDIKLYYIRILKVFKRLFYIKCRDI